MSSVTLPLADTTSAGLLGPTDKAKLDGLATVATSGAYADLTGKPGLAAVATSGSAADLGSGTLAAARLPNPSSSALGGVQSKASAAHNFLTSISTSGVPSAAQPASTDLSDITTAGTSMLSAASADAQTALLSNVVGDSGTGGTKGMVPAPAAGDAAAGKFLKADGTFAVPSGSGGNVNNSGTPTAGQIAEWTNATTVKGVTMSGDATIDTAGVITVTKTGGTAFATVATSGAYSDLTGKPTLVTALTGLSDVSVTEGIGIDGQVLYWLNSAGKWEAKALATSATTDTTNASNISSGTLAAARLPNPSASTLGGVESYAAVTHQFLTSISTSGVPASAQPAAGDISGLATSATTDTTNASNISSGTLGAARLPNPSSTTLGGVESYAAVSHQFLTSISTSGVPASAQPAVADLSDTKTGSGNLVLATSPTLTTPTIGVATATSVNKMAITAPATSSTLAVADGKTATISNTLTFTGTDSSSVAFGAGGTVLYGGTADQTISGGANVTSLSQSTGNLTVDCGARPLQYITNNGAWTLTAPSSDGSCVLLVTNGASASTTTFSGFTVGSNTGDALTTTNTSKFMIFIIRINGTSSYTIKALQ